MKMKNKNESGLTLIELLIVLLISSFMAYGLFVVLHSTLFNANTQRSLSGLQEAERSIVANMRQIANAGGYFVINPTTEEISNGIPLSNTLFTNQFPAQNYTAPFGDYQAGQYVDGANTATDGDVLDIRFQSALNNNPNEPTTLNCLGESNPSTTPIIYNNSYFVNTSTQSLDCAVNGGTPHILAGHGSNGGINIQSMNILYGVSSRGTKSVNQFETANQVQNWQDVINAQVTINFYNPLYVASENNGQPEYIPFTFMINFLGGGGANVN